MKTSPVGTELFHADGQTGFTEVSRLYNLANVPKNVALLGKIKIIQILTKNFRLCSSDRQMFALDCEIHGQLDCGLLLNMVSRNCASGLSCSRTAGTTVQSD